MIRITDFSGQVHWVAPTAVASVTETCASSQWHGIKAIVKLFDGTVIEALDEARRVAERVACDLVPRDG